MTKRLPYFMFALLFLTLAVPLRASPPGLGVVVQSAEYDPAKDEITVRFYNSTKQDVTAYNFSVRIDYADGTTRLDDLLRELPPGETDPRLTFVAGTTREEKLPQFGQFGVQHPQITRVVSVVDMVAYADLTAEATNEAAFNRLLEHRKADSAALQEINDALKRSLSAENPPKAALAELEKLAKKCTPKGNTGNALEAAMGLELGGTIQNIRRASGTVSIAQFTEYVKDHDSRLAAMKTNSELRRIDQ